MKVCAIDKLVSRNFNVIFVNALQQLWHETKAFQCIGKPKKQNLLLFLSGCKITYTDKNGQTFIANSGDVVYTPVGSEYKVQLSDFDGSSSHTIGINFLLFDDLGESVVLSKDIQIFHKPESQALSLLFRRALDYDAAQPLLKSRIIMMEILLSLSSSAAVKNTPEYIVKALRYLSEHINENPTVAMLSELSSVSEVYFRKQFKKYVGATPIEYRNSLRLDRARAYLEYGEISVQEISDMLGYATVSHFIKEFRIRYGCPPLQYRKQIGE
jgi:AraC-like DNA-binding protein